MNDPLNPDALAYYRQQCDELGARIMRLQEAVARAQREAQRSRTLALVVQQVHAVSQSLPEEDSYPEQLGAQLLMLLVEQLKIDAAGLIHVTNTPGHYRLVQALGIPPQSVIPVLEESPNRDACLPLEHPILRATGLAEALWVEAPPSRCMLLLGLRPKAGARHRQLNAADSQIAEAAIRVYDGLLGRQSALSAQRHLQERLDLALEGADVGLYEVNLETGQVHYDDRFVRILGGDPAHIPRNISEWRERIHPDDAQTVEHIAAEALTGQRDRVQLEYRFRHQSGAWIWLLDRGKGFEHDAKGRPRRAAGSCLDITEHKMSEAAIHQLAFFDPLTELPNRRLFLDRLASVQASARRNGRVGAVLFLDLDRFKQINDARGHEIGDQLLREVASRLRALLRAEDTVARFGGDEFVILLGNLSEDEAEASHYARAVAEKIRHSVALPVNLPAGEIHSEISIGITLLRGTEDGDHDLLREADTALYRAKEGGRNCVRFFEKSMQEAAEARFNLERELKQAIEAERDLTLYYQPQVDASGRLTGTEALLRWRHPGQGMISPAVFIPVAEDTSLILPIGRWVLRQACHFLAHTDTHKHALRMSVNVSPRQFHQADFVSQVHQAVRDAGIPPERLTLELTEGVVIEDIQSTVLKMRELKDLGVRLSIDDFGTGYSSLSYLKRMPVDELKIDRSFIQDLSTDSNDAALVEAILSVCRHLRVSVMAEGVETEEQLHFLRARRCDGYQGYYFGMPMPGETLLQSLGD
ncbi:Bacteriophytochrome cph2 [Thiorhodovibrio winogradskyi]|uniref:Bacteriophytochrome cph2 n=1 Tax=Thiorhodovibrio winogradskyi TaxID=77007 RepID=A0ABZ0S765_9GAMM|nr:EAL domain-containing protein [Thiorhodovibrio winogradskyi]